MGSMGRKLGRLILATPWLASRKGAVRRVAAVLCGALALSGVASPTLATATRASFTATLTTVAFCCPDRAWISDGILHVRGSPQEFEMTGDLVGSASVIGNVDLNLAEGEGTLFGTFVVSTPNTTWEGYYRGIISGGALAAGSGTMVGHGDDRTLFRATFTELGGGTGGFGPYLVEGEILSTAA